MTMRVAATIVLAGFFLCALAIAAVCVDDRESGELLIIGLLVVGAGTLIAIWAS